LRLADWDRECETRSEAEGGVLLIMYVSARRGTASFIRVVVGFRMWMLAKRGARMDGRQACGCPDPAAKVRCE
jgi:hypothetical protein